MDLIKEIILNCIKRDRNSQTKLYNLLSPKMYVVCQRYAPNKEEAEDILQEGFIKVFENLYQFKFDGSFEGWVRKIMVNRALQKYRSKAQLHIVSNHNYHDAFGFDEDITTKIEVKELIKMVQQLSPAYRMVFNLYVFEGMKHKDIAAELGISEGTSKSNLYDARMFLQKQLVKRSETALLKVNAI